MRMKCHEDREAKWLLIGLIIWHSLAQIIMVHVHRPKQFFVQRINLCSSF